MTMKRRDFLKLAGSMGAGTIYALYGGELGRLFGQVVDGKVHVVWLQGASDSGCTISLLQGVSPDLVDAITNFRLAVDFHPTLMVPAGDEAVTPLTAALNGSVPLDVLIVEGAVPAGSFCTVGELGGVPVPVETWIKNLGAKAKWVVAVGTCAAFGGIPAAAPNPTNSRPVSALVAGKRVINIPGCPAHPDWILLTLATIIGGVTPALDGLGRPVRFFREEIHEHCPLEERYDDRYAQSLAQPGCLRHLGCRGPMTRGDCPTRYWNNKTSFCITGPWSGATQLYEAGAPCIGCTEPGFPDPPFSPFYEPAGGDRDDD